MGIALIVLAIVARAELELPADYGLATLPPCDNSEISIAEECPGGSGTGISWAEYGKELYLARSAMFATGPEAAVEQVRVLLARLTTRFSDTFECTPALLATHFSMARLLALQGRSRRALAMLHLGFIFVRDRGYSECTPWPVQGWDMMLAGKTLAARVRELDKQSITHVPPSYREPGLRVAIVTICAYAADEPVRLICDENRRLYSALHGYDVHFFTDAAEIAPHAAAGMDVNDGVHKAFFWKVNAVKNILESNRYDWVIWMDCDAFFMDPGRTLDSVIAMYTQNKTVASMLPPVTGVEPELEVQLRHRIHPEPPIEVSLIFAVDSTGINNGVWMLQNTPWAHDFLWRWWHSPILEGPGKEHNCSDQSTMVHTLLYNRAMDFDDAWDRMEGPIWPPESRVAAQEHLQSFHQATAVTAMSRAWEEGDFIKHHPGCHYYRPQCQMLYDEAEAIFRNKASSALSALQLGHA